MQQEFKTIKTNGLNLRVAISGEGPLVVLIHGWPESWYSWRHQIKALSEAGYRVAVPDVRGYGGSDKPEAIEAYSMAEMTNDMAGLISALGENTAVVIGHDWGVPIAWNTALLHPHRVSAVAGLSVPYTGSGPAPFIDIAKQVYKDKFFYQLYFQEPGVAEAELEADIPVTLRKIYYWISGEGLLAQPLHSKPADATLLDDMADPGDMLDWMSLEDLEYYVSQFEASGFRGPLNRYRNSHRDFKLLSPLAGQKIHQPAAFIAGTLEPVLNFVPGVDLVETMRGNLSDLRFVEMIEGAGHWVQQERPDQVNKALLRFLSEVA
ncbi:MAG: alpha/beta hydrolase [Rhodospirillaceae bacterium]|nr:alpha/beta hydrolase [Rhodospirillaceae bacterium]MBT4688416.1 alpha/beta hydrolase [Rhodospirillaceae bacterium]MBT5081774.1 alpha/beta hydrolase [Rhodospirillaceae bacterium]MBT5527364.1 alpha/beta hydrolase [Rhodospirillaceae bacterium]MBT5881742.1 alpha/beta hydrolase [Rhodospirillaceae bacterium]